MVMMMVAVVMILPSLVTELSQDLEQGTRGLVGRHLPLFIGQRPPAWDLGLDGFPPPP